MIIMIVSCEIKMLTIWKCRVTFLMALLNIWKMIFLWFSVWMKGIRKQIMPFSRFGERGGQKWSNKFICGGKLIVGRDSWRNFLFAGVFLMLPCLSSKSPRKETDKLMQWITFTSAHKCLHCLHLHGSVFEAFYTKRSRDSISFHFFSFGLCRFLRWFTGIACAPLLAWKKFFFSIPESHHDEIV